jgi:hypothetical protein
MLHNAATTSKKAAYPQELAVRNDSDKDYQNYSNEKIANLIGSDPYPENDEDPIGHVHLIKKSLPDGSTKNYRLFRHQPFNNYGNPDSEWMLEDVAKKKFFTIDGQFSAVPTTLHDHDESCANKCVRRFDDPYEKDDFDFSKVKTNPLVYSENVDLAKIHHHPDGSPNLYYKEGK